MLGWGARGVQAGLLGGSGLAGHPCVLWLLEAMAPTVVPVRLVAGAVMAVAAGLGKRRPPRGGAPPDGLGASGPKAGADSPQDNYAAVSGNGAAEPQGHDQEDVDASLVHSAFMDALGHRDGDSLGRRLEDGWPVFVQFDLYLAYELRDPSATFFNAGALKAVAAFEVALRGLPEWDALCQLAHGEYRALCEPGTSFVGFAVPSRALSPGSAVPTALATDGRGGEALPAAAAVHLAGRHGLAEVLFPIGYGASATPDEGPTALRSAFRLLIQICTTADPESYRAEQNDELVERWKAFAGDVLMPFIREWSEDQDIIKIWFGGTDIETTEVTRALRGDLALAGTSLLVVLLCMAAHLRSALLAVGGLAAVGLSVPLSYVVLVLLK
ncbi:unnamed protein product, partial [Prorocentrum cordatum]